MDKLKYVSITLCIIAIILFIFASQNIKLIILGFILIIIAVLLHKYAISSMKDKIIEQKYKEIQKKQ